jgi:hypothetical protein
VPRISRFTLGSKIDVLFIEIIELIFTASYTSRDKKLALVEQASIKLDMLKFFLQLTWEFKILENKKYVQISTPLADIGRQLGGWQKQLLRPIPPQE